MKNVKLITSIASCFFMGQAFAIEPIYDGEDGIRAKIFETNCLACHSSTLTGAGRNGAPDNNYDTYADAMKFGGGAVKRGVIDMDMPPVSSALEALTEEQKQALKNWKALGFPEKTLPTIYSSESQELSLPKVYLKDENGDITLKWKADMKIIPDSDPIQFELLDVTEHN
jgi:cytochrome c5